MSNFAEIGDRGEDWFGEDAVERMLDWTEEEIDHSAKILDVGTGNGHLLFELAQRGYDASHLFGIDYSRESIALCHAISEKTDTPPTFQQVDILTQDLPSDLPSAYDLILDKGTYDAICLSDSPVDGVRPSALYPTRLAKYLKDDGRILITSCNWTQAELVQKFTTAESSLAFESAIKVPSFQFGGQSGQTTATVAFKKITHVS